MIDWRITHIRKAEDLQDNGWRLVEENVGLDDFVLRSRRKEYRPRSIWLWAIASVYSPPQGEQS